MSQGDLLNEKKRLRMRGGSSGGSSLPDIHGGEVEGGVEAAVYSANEGEDGGSEQESDEGCSGEDDDVPGIVKRQLNVKPVSLGAPPAHDDFCDAEKAVGGYFAGFETRVSTGTLRLRTPSPPPPRPLTPTQILSKGDYYTRPDLDEVSQRVVLESLVKQQEEEAAGKETVRKRREVTMAKFEAVKRERLLLMIQSGLPVAKEVVDAYGLQKALKSKQGRDHTMVIRARNNSRREEVLSCRGDVPPHLQTHRAACKAILSRRILERSSLQQDLGTTLTPLPIPPPISTIINRQAQQQAALESSLLDAQSLSDLSTFADHLHRAKKTQRPQPRQRDVPYTLDAPYRFTPSHRPPIILEK
eukprot:TRINITY_DN15353_c0_g1_i1.p1 TRINITY_DN15353_c0_g1~~TRINITY_DN15353_c0_g1_i1.p1  ORF type:complete len:358 (+),score=90.12 TRINITY_DN15353_c0_g1_i1:64-1137(+)